MPEPDENEIKRLLLEVEMAEKDLPNDYPDWARARRWLLCGALPMIVILLGIGLASLLAWNYLLFIGGTAILLCGGLGACYPQK